MNQILENFSWEDYFSIDAVHSSTLKEVYSRSLYHAMIPKGAKSDSLKTGGATDELLFDPENFKNKYALRPLDDNGKELNANSNAYKEWKASLTNQEILSKKEYDECYFLAKTLKEDASISLWLNSLVYKQPSLLYKDPYFGVDCIARPDGISKINGNIILWDLKTTKSSNPRFFKFDIYKLGYHLQMAHYLLGMIETGLIATPIENCTAFLVAIEKKTNVITIFKLNPSMIMEGLRIRNEALEKLVKAKEKRYFPAYSDEIVEVDHITKEESLVVFDDIEDDEDDEDSEAAF